MASEENNLNTYAVEIAGMYLRLKSSHDEKTVNEVVSYVNSKIKEALPLTKNESLQTAAILACLNLGEEMILFKRQARENLEIVEERAQAIVSSLESSQGTQLGLDH